jgi:hypothetical protein
MYVAHGSDGNIAVYTWLISSLEDYYRIHGRGDGNANEVFLSICNLLVALGLVNEVVLTRMPIGHTHEDIDDGLLDC